jgi:hypothetical protein
LAAETRGELEAITQERLAAEQRERLAALRDGEEGFSGKHIWHNDLLNPQIYLHKLFQHYIQGRSLFSFSWFLLDYSM